MPRSLHQRCMTRKASSVDSAYAALLAHWAMANEGTSLTAIGERIRLTREALGYEDEDKEAAAFARLIGTTPQALNNWEKGSKRPSVDSAMLIVRATGVTLDWIYLGLRSGLPHHLVQKLTERETLREAS